MGMILWSWNLSAIGILTSISDNDKTWYVIQIKYLVAWLKLVCYKIIQSISKVPVCALEKHINAVSSGSEVQVDKAAYH